MSSGNGIPEYSIERQLEHDRRMRVLDRLHDLASQGTKGLVVLNGGAAVAMLALVQTLVERPIYRAFKPYAVMALALFLVGAFLASIVFFFQQTYLSHAAADTGRQELWRRVSWGILVAAAVAAFVGGALVAVGVWCAL